MTETTTTTIGEAKPQPFAEIRDPNYPEYAPYFEQPPCMP